MSTDKLPEQAELEGKGQKPKTIRMPSEGQKFKLLGTRFEIVKARGTSFKARLISE